MRSVVVAGNSLAGEDRVIRAVADLVSPDRGSLRILLGIPEEAPAVRSALARALANHAVPWSVEVVDGPIRKAVLDGDEHDLVVLPASGSDPSVAHEIAAIALRAPGAILVTRGGPRVPPETALLPLGEADLDSDALERTLDWLALLKGVSGDGRPSIPTTLQVMRLGAGSGRTGEEVHAFERHLARTHPLELIRSGVHIRRRVEPPGRGEAGGLRWLRKEDLDLLILRRHEVCGRPPTQDELLWLRLLHATCASTLLLPKGQDRPCTSTTAFRTSLAWAERPSGMQAGIG